MKTLRVLYYFALADFYERTRRTSFLLVLAAVIYLGVLVNSGSLYLSVVPGDLASPGFRGEFNSAWVGAMIVPSSSISIPTSRRFSCGAD